MALNSGEEKRHTEQLQSSDEQRNIKAAEIYGLRNARAASDGSSLPVTSQISGSSGWMINCKV